MTVRHPLTGRAPSDRWPVRPGIVGRFGLTRTNSDGSPKMHRGIDWIAPIGSRVYAAHDGKVVRAGEESGGRGYGQRIYLLRPAEGADRLVLTIYAHLCVEFVNLLEEVRAGHCLGLVGRSGNITHEPDHIHHEVRIGDQGKPSAVDPEWFYHERGA